MDNAWGDVILGPHIDPCGSHGHAMPGADVARSFIEAVLALFEEYGVAASPVALLRLEDVLSAYLVARRLEEALWLVDAEAAESAKGRLAAVAAAAEPAAKARERLRKAMKELEDSCAKAGTPIDVGLADKVRPLIEKAQGVLEDALKREQEKRRRHNVRPAPGPRP